MGLTAFSGLLFKLVGAPRFELGTPCTPSEDAVETSGLLMSFATRIRCISGKSRVSTSPLPDHIQSGSTSEGANLTKGESLLPSVSSPCSLDLANVAIQKFGRIAVFLLVEAVPS